MEVPLEALAAAHLGATETPFDALCVARGCHSLGGDDPDRATAVERPPEHARRREILDRVEPPAALFFVEEAAVTVRLVDVRPVGPRDDCRDAAGKAPCDAAGTRVRVEVEIPVAPEQHVVVA